MNLSLRGKTAVVCGSTQGYRPRDRGRTRRSRGELRSLVARRQALQSVVSELDRSQGQHEFAWWMVADGAAVESTAAEIAARQRWKC